MIGKLLLGLVRRVVAFWAEPVRAEPVAAFRILLGSVGLASVLCSLVLNFNLYLGPEGLCPPGSLDTWLARTWRESLLRGPLTPRDLASPVPAAVTRAWADWCCAPEHTWFLLWVWVAALACLTIGLGTQVAAVASWALTISFNNRLPWLTNGGDALLGCGLFYLMFARSGAVWSVDAVWRRRTQPVLIPAWPLRLMQLQLCAVYFFTGLAKLGEDWYTGEAVYWVLNDVSLVRWPYHAVPVPLWLCRFLSWSTLGFEIGFPLLVLIRPVRPFLLVAGILFHLGILIHTEVGYFSQVSMCWYVLFLRGETLARFVSRLRRTAPVETKSADGGPTVPCEGRPRIL
jgi:hypothetical protein